MKRTSRLSFAAGLVMTVAIFWYRPSEAAEQNTLPTAFSLHAYFAWRDGDTNRLAELSSDVRKQLAATKAGEVEEQRRWLRLLVLLDARRRAGTELVVDWLLRYHALHRVDEVFDRRMFQETFYAVPEEARREFWTRLYQAGKLRELDYDFRVLADVEGGLRVKGPKEEFEKFRVMKEKWLRENPDKWNRPLPPGIGESAKLAEARAASFAKDNERNTEMNRKSMEQMARTAKYTKLRELAATRKHREALEYANSLKASDLTPGLWENVLYDRCVIAHRLFWQQRQNPAVGKEREGYYAEYVKGYGSSPRRKDLDAILALVNFQ